MIDFEEISLLAYKNKENENFNIVERYAFIKLKELYEMYKSGECSKEQATKEKNKIKKRFNDDSFYYERCKEVYKEYNERKNELEYVLYKVEKSKDKMETIELLLDIVGKFISDDDFKQRNLCKFR